MFETNLVILATAMNSSTSSLRSPPSHCYERPRRAEALGDVPLCPRAACASRAAIQSWCGRVYLAHSAISTPSAVAGAYRLEHTGLETAHETV
jgi:hypothetical protein